MKKIAFLLVSAVSCSLAAASPIGWLAYQGPAVGARAAALSGSIIADDNDPCLIFWNPAGLANIKWTMASCSYLHSNGLIFDPLFSGPKRVNNVAFAGRGLGMSWRSLARYEGWLDSGDGADTVNRYLRYGVDEFALAAAKADDIYQSISLGLSAKFIWARMTELEQARIDTLWGRAEINDEDGIGYGLDLGLHARMEPFMLGINVQNLVGKVYWNNFDDDKLKPKILAGISWYNGRLPRITASAEKFWGNGVPELRYAAGGEYKYTISGYGALILRAGASQYRHAPDDEYDWSLGLGYVYKRFLVDAASMDQRDEAGTARQKSYMATISFFME